MLFLLSAALLCFGCFMLAACNKNKAGKTETELVLSLQELEMKRFTQQTLTVTSTNAEGTVSWTSSAPEVAVVEEGTVTALSVGEAVITASIGDVSDTCIVTVIENESVPIVALDKEAADVAVGGSLTVRASVLFDGDEYPSDFSFEMENTEIATVSAEGVITGVKAGGETVLTVSTTWRGASLTETIPVKVKEVVQLSWEHGDITVYTSDAVDGLAKTFQAIPVVTENGKPVSDAEVEFLLDDGNGGEVSSIVTINDAGLLEAKGTEGTAYLTFLYTSSGGIEYQSPRLTVSCQIPVQTIDGIDIELGVDSNNLENTDITLTGAIFGDADTEITKIVCDGEELTFSDGKFTVAGSGEYAWTVYNSAGYAWETDVTLATLIISDAEELDKMSAILTASADNAEPVTDGSNQYTVYTYHGYFILDDDIDYKNATYYGPAVLRFNGITAFNKPSSGFAGVFDGRGHTIRNITFAHRQITDIRDINSGMFGAVAASGTVKNVGLLNISVTSGFAAALACNLYGTVDNVYIHVSNYTAGSDAGIIASQMLGGKITNSVIYLDNVNVSGNAGAIVSCITGTDYTVENVYVVKGNIVNDFSHTWGGHSNIDNKIDSTKNVISLESSFEMSSVEQNGFVQEYWNFDGKYPRMQSAIETKQIVLNQSNVSLSLYETGNLTATITNSWGEKLSETVIWSSSAPDRVTVEDGLLTAVGVGDAVITAKLASGETASCAVSVSDSDQQPTLVCGKDSVSLSVGASVTLDLSVFFGDDSYTDFSAEYSGYDDTVISVENGTIRGLANGETSVTVSALWRGARLTLEVAVTVSNDVVLAWGSDSKLTLYTSVDLNDYMHSAQTSPSVTVNGDQIEEPTLTFAVEDASGLESTLVSVGEGGLITANQNCEEGTVYVRFIYDLNGNPFYSPDLEIEVICPTVTITDTIDIELGVNSEYIENDSLQLTGAMFGEEDAEILRVVQGGAPLSVTEGVIEGISSGEYAWTVYNSAGYAWEANVVLATLIISDAGELDVMSLILQASVLEEETVIATYTHRIYHGYFILDRNIDYNGQKYDSPIGVRESNINNGFVGVFDGRGYTIKNIVFERVNDTDNRHVKSGLFGAVGYGGMVKNLSITEVHLTNTWAATFGIALFGKIENVHVEIVDFAASASGIAMYAYASHSDGTQTVNAGAEMYDSSVRMNLSAAVTGGSEGGGFFLRVNGDGYAGKFVNNYFINEQVTYTNGWGNMANSLLKDKLEATGNLNYILPDMTQLTAQTYEGGNTPLLISLEGAVFSDETEIILFDGNRIVDYTLNTAEGNTEILLDAAVFKGVENGNHELLILYGGVGYSVELTVNV